MIRFFLCVLKFIYFKDRGGEWEGVFIVIGIVNWVILYECENNVFVIILWVFCMWVILLGIVDIDFVFRKYIYFSII